MNNGHWVVTYFKDGNREYARFENETDAIAGVKRIKEIGATNIYVGKVKRAELTDYKYLTWVLMVVGSILWIIIAIEIVHYFW